jgi:acetate kinase
MVHGGEQFRQAVRIDTKVLVEIERFNELAPLHNPACLAGVRGALTFLGPEVPMVAVFDTAFHQTLPECASTYAIPQELTARHGIRRYGFHGLAHASLAAGYASFTGRPLQEVRLITLQLGNGCSATAIRHGHSVDTSMGFTPLEGLVMGTRSGDLDAAVVSFLVRRARMDAEDVERLLNEDSGLHGLSGVSHDMRRLLTAAEQEQNTRAALAIEVFCYRVRKYIGAYLAVLGGADAVLFGGGIGEQAPTVRARICAGMEWCGLRLDPERNTAAVGLDAGKAAQISCEDTTLPVYVVAADEETWIARETVQCLRQAQAG